MSYRESLNEVKAKTESELSHFQKVLENSIYIFEATTGMKVVRISPVTDLKGRIISWNIDYRLK